MTDIPLQTDTKPKITSTFVPLAMTGMGSSAIGDQLGDAISQLIAWRVALNCNCVPPDKAMSSIHTICVSAVVLVAYIIHYLILKQRES